MICSPRIFAAGLGIDPTSLSRMSRADNCYDNAFLESCWSSCKRELEVDDYDSAATARKTVAEYVRYYRFERKHSSIGNLSPHQFETATKTRNSAIGLSVKSSASQPSPNFQRLHVVEVGK
jgi:transposase InsO family protein